MADVCRLYLKKVQWDGKMAKYGFWAAIASMFILYTLILIDSIISEQKEDQNINCEQIWYLCVNVICLALCIVALLVLLMHQREENKRMLVFQFDQAKVYSPLAILWTWIGINAAAQAIDLVETGLFLSTTPAQNCMIITTSEVSNNIVKFLFVVFTMDMGYIATLWYLRQLRGQAEDRNERLSSHLFS